jgi:FkbM family methyltransferase
MKIISLVRIFNRLRIFNWLRWFGSKIQTFDKHIVSFYRPFISKGDICFDIGANVGQKTEIFLKLGAKVVAVEPQHSCFNFLKGIYKKNGNVTLINAALGATVGKQEMMICEANAMSSLSPDWVLKAKEIWKDHEWNDKEIVQVETLDRLISRFGLPHFIKIDVEGFEIDVIKGLNKKVPFICFELTPITARRLKDAYDHLSKYGEISFNLAKGEPINFVFKEWVKWEEASKYVAKNQNNIFCDVFVKFH